MAYLGSSIAPEAALRWSIFFITSVWECTRQIWKARNSSVHVTEAEQATNILTEMKTNIIRLHEEFNHNPNMLLPCHHHLFKRISLEDRLRQGYDDIQCWLRSVAKAREVLQHHKDVLCLESASFFPIASTTAAQHNPYNHHLS